MLQPKRDLAQNRKIVLLVLASEHEQYWKLCGWKTVFFIVLTDTDVPVRVIVKQVCKKLKIQQCDLDWHKYINLHRRICPPSTSKSKNVCRCDVVTSFFNNFGNDLCWWSMEVDNLLEDMFLVRVRCIQLNKSNGSDH